jgi:hypothetical protein
MGLFDHQTMQMLSNWATIGSFISNLVIFLGIIYKLKKALPVFLVKYLTGPLQETVQQQAQTLQETQKEMIDMRRWEKSQEKENEVVEATLESHGQTLGEHGKRITSLEEKLK